MIIASTCSDRYLGLENRIRKFKVAPFTSDVITNSSVYTVIEICSYHCCIICIHKIVLVADQCLNF